MRAKIVLALSIVLACYIPLYHLLFERIIAPRFAEIERDRAVEYTGRCVEVVREQVLALADTCARWSQWTEIEGALRSPTPGFAQALFGAPMSVHTIHLVAMGAPQGNVAWASAFVGGRFSRDARLGLIEAGGPLAPLMRPDGASSDVSGIVLTPTGPMIVATQAVPTPGDPAGRSGVLLLAKSLDEALVAYLNERARTSFSLLKADPATLDPLARNALDALNAGRDISIHAQDGVIHCYTMLRAIGGGPALLLHASLPEQITEKGRSAIRLGVASSVLSAAVLLLALFWLLNANLAAPLARLTRQVQDLRKKRTLGARIGITRGDELGMLAREFDDTLAEIEKLHGEMSQQAYRLGMAEMASGVLHDTRNILAPLPFELENMRRLLNSLPLDHLGRAAMQLPQEANPARARILAEFLRLGMENAQNMLNQCRDRLDRLFALAGRMDALLHAYDPDQEATPATTPLRLETVIGQAWALLPPDVSGACVQGRTPEPMPAVLGNAIKLPRLLAAILSAMLREGPAGSRLVLDVSTGEAENTGLVLLRFTNAADGRTPEGLAEIFQRGQGQQASDTPTVRGLHWCANAANAMGARMNAQSEGPGTGLSIELALPVAGEKQERHD